MNKKIILSIGSFVATAVPAAAAISCSTTWTSWSKKDEPQTVTKFKGSEIIQRDKYIVRPDLELMNAWDPSSKELDISMINNQFELVKAISNILSIASVESVDNYWNDFAKMKAYLSSITKSQEIKLVYKGKELIIDWDVTTIITNAISSLDNYDLLATQADKDNAKAFNVEAKGISGGQPVAFGEVARVGAPLTANATVKELMDFDMGFALALSKLVNLPQGTFTEFTHLMDAIDSTIDNLWSFISSTTFLEDKGIDFSIGTSGKIGTYDIEKKYKSLVEAYRQHNLPLPGEDKRIQKIDEFKKGYLKAQFIIQALKH